MPPADPVTDPWTLARAGLDGLPGGGLNIAHEAVDRHADGALRDAVALRWLTRDGRRVDVSYDALREDVARFHDVLRTLGVERGERVFGLAERVPALWVAALGTVRRGAVFCPLFSAFGPEPVHQRLHLGDGRALVTTAALYEKRVAPVRDRLPGLRHVLVLGAEGNPPPGTLDLDALLDAATPVQAAEPTGPEDPALLHFTSGTTGAPKGALHVHGAVVAHAITGREVLDLSAGTTYWCTADPGWVTGTSYGIVAPLVQGVTALVDERDFDGARWYATLEEERVEVLYTAPTAIRMLMRLGLDAAAGRSFPALRLVASVGEPLPADAVLWGREAFGHPIHDNWWQTETGAIMIANRPGDEIRPGSMGRPLPGIEAALVLLDDDGEPVVHDGTPELVEDPGADGMLALRAGWPSMFRAYLGQEERYRRSFAGDWYLSGDLARRDEDGFFWFVGRGDDVIKSAGHLIGPFEVESALLLHDAVVDVAVYGVPDAVMGARVEAQVVLAPGVEESDALRRELVGFARTRLGAAVAPRAILFADAVPHTRSGKTLRRLVRARRLGLPEGDTSTLERA